jgi:hypothetical protein
LKREDIPADYPAPIENGLNEAGVKMVQRRDPPQLPAWFMQSVDLTMKLMQQIAGGAGFDAGPEVSWPDERPYGRADASGDY